MTKLSVKEKSRSCGGASFFELLRFPFFFTLALVPRLFELWRFDFDRLLLCNSSFSWSTFSSSERSSQRAIFCFVFAAETFRLTRLSGTASVFSFPVCSPSTIDESKGSVTSIVMSSRIVLFSSAPARGDRSLSTWAGDSLRSAAVSAINASSSGFFAVSAETRTNGGTPGSSWPGSSSLSGSTDRRRELPESQVAVFRSTLESENNDDRRRLFLAQKKNKTSNNVTADSTVNHSVCLLWWNEPHR